MSGPCGSGWPDFLFIDGTLTRRSDPRSPEASANIFMFRIEHFWKLEGSKSGKYEHMKSCQFEQMFYFENINNMKS